MRKTGFHFSSSRSRGAVRILLLRGVNVGGAGKLPMAGLRGLLDRLGHGPARSHIQSGNAVIFPDAASGALAARISAAIAESFGFAPGVRVLDLAELQAALGANPFPVTPEEGQKLHLYFPIE